MPSMNASISGNNHTKGSKGKLNSGKKKNNGEIDFRTKYKTEVQINSIFYKFCRFVNIGLNMGIVNLETNVPSLMVKLRSDRSIMSQIITKPRNVYSIMNRDIAHMVFVANLYTILGI